MSSIDFDLTLIETEANNTLQQHQVGMEILRMLKTKYINPLYESFSMETPKLKMSISKFENFCNYDFLFHVLTILKHKVFEVPYDPQNFSIGKEKESVLSEIKVNRMFPISKPRQSRKRGCGGDKDESESSNKRSKRLFRSFRNPQMESCWLNSCMQLVLAAFDHLPEVASDGSTLWNLLLSYRMKDEDEIINPLEIRDLLLEKERMRIVSKNVQPVNRLFHYANSTTMDENRLKHMSEASRIGQQDCKDFFECVEQNRECWDDVYNLFRFSITKSTLCMNCMHESRPAGYDSHSFLLFESPQQDVTLHQYVGMHLNESTDVTNWRHEDGCNMIGNGKNSIRLTNVGETKFLTIVVNRLVRSNDGTLSINNRKISIQTDVIIKDANDENHRFQTIAVIYHIGHVTDNNDTRGHYMADVCDAKTGKWYRTSDDNLPSEIKSVSDSGYIFLLKKV